MSDLRRVDLEWALNASETELLEALGRSVTDGAGRFSPARLASLGLAWFRAHETELRAKLCPLIVSAMGQDSDPVTVAYSVGVVAATTIDPAFAGPVTLAYAVALVLRKMTSRYCDGTEAV